MPINFIFIIFLKLFYQENFFQIIFLKNLSLGVKSKEIIN